MASDLAGCTIKALGSTRSASTSTRCGGLVSFDPWWLKSEAKIGTPPPPTPLPPSKTQGDWASREERTALQNWGALQGSPGF